MFVSSFQVLWKSDWDTNSAMNHWGTICMVPYYNANRNVQTWIQSPTNKSLSPSGQGSMVCEQMPVVVDAIHSRNKTVPRRVDPVRDWKWHYALKRVETQGSMVDMLHLFTNLMTIFHCLYTRWDIGLILQLEQRLADLGLWTCNYTRGKMWDTIPYQCPRQNGSLTKPPFEIRYW